MPPSQESLRLAADAIRGTMMERVGPGVVTATGVPLRVGRSVAVWEVRADDDEGNLVASGTLTVSIRQP